jgi:peptidoglycan/LPS O-acetylase OafA/YrhL
LFWSLCLVAQLYPARLAVLAVPLRHKLAQWLGAISYPIYLVNEPIQKLLGVGLARFVAGDAVLFTAIWVPAAILLPVAAAALMHRHVEAPVLLWARTLAQRGTMRAAPIVART